MNISFSRLIILFIIICIFYKFCNIENYENDEIYLKIFRNNYPWKYGFKKKSDLHINFEVENKKKYKKTISSIIIPKTVYNLENKMHLSKFLKNKSYYPETYIYNKYNKKLPKKDDIWFIKKCGYSTYGGYDVNMVNNVNDIKGYLKDNNSYIIQKTIDNLYLYDNKKGDIRMYYLVVLYKNKLNFYLYKDGFIKLAKDNYNKNNLSIDTQITNTSQLKKTDKPRCIMFNKSFHNYDVFIEKIKVIMKDFSEDIKRSFPSYYKSYYALEYQLCGPDIIFDNNYNPYLIELNSNFPAYIMNNTEDIIDMKKNIAKVISNNLFKPAINREPINLEEYGFIKL
tara:strand:+ start:145 stop:1164 length:1020 start_codon:yes stop_codon:yes gene_type:complete